MKNSAISCPCREFEKTTCRYSKCCEPLHLAHKPAASAEKLMRSRYSAFTMNLYPYLIETHHISTRGKLSISTLEDSNQSTQWLGLKILSAENDKVSFQAYFLHRGEITCLHEDSEFTNVRNDNGVDRWYYLGGHHDPAFSKLPKRRELCFCGSQKKYKNCHCP